MSRVAKAPVAVPAGVDVSVADNVLTIKGSKGTLTQVINEKVELTQEDNELTFAPANNDDANWAMAGTFRSLINNMVVGVTEGYKTEQELVGVGYRANVKGNLLEMSLGYSHPIVMEIPTEVKVTAETVKGQPPLVTLESADKQLIGQVAAKIRSLRKPEPYKGKGIKFKGEILRRKAGKTAAK